MGLCSSSNIELNPLTAEEVQQEEIAAKLNVAVDEIVSLNFF